MSEYPELDRLLSRYLDGSASADDMARLEAELSADERFAEHFACWCLTHRQVSELLAESKLHQMMDEFVTSAPGLPKEAFRSRRDSSASELDKLSTGRSGDWKARLLAWAAIAGALAAGAGWMLVHRPAPARTGGEVARSDAAANPGDPKIVATLTQVVDCDWASNAPVLHHGQLLRVGDHVGLDSGMAKVTYDCGAEVVLQGPCDFWIHNPMVGYLSAGRITAHVPRRAFSFAILSPKADMVDLGTSFGVVVGDNDRTELHVFEGEVLCSEPNRLPGDRHEIIHVTADNAMEFGEVAGRPNGIAMDKEQFSPLIAVRRAVDIEAGHLTEDALALWLAADVAVTTDSEGRVIAWQDIVYGDNESGEDAIQVEEQARPLLVKDAVNGHAAIRFDGQTDYLLTTPLETTDDQTVMFVCQFSEQAYDTDRKWGGQIINYDGPPSRYLSDTLEPGVLQIGEPLLEDQFKPTLLTAQVFAGFIGSATVESGRIDAKPVGANKPVVVAYVYDYGYGQGRSFLEINGRTFGESRAFAPQGITSRKIIGRHAWMQNFFHGDLAEMLIFNKALTPEELAQTTAYLADKYSIKLDE